MRYGLNWGAPAIPPELLKGIRTRRRKGIPCAKGTVAVLEGAASNKATMRGMILQAENGRRGQWWEYNKRHDLLYCWIFSPAGEDRVFINGVFMW